MQPCDICGKTSHVWFNCPLRDTKPKDWKPKRLSKNQPLAAVMPHSTEPALEQVLSDSRKDLINPSSGHCDTGVRGAGEAVIPKPKRGRPKTIADMAAYKAAKQREYRLRSKASKPIQ
jgi:hypothetical protein